jgi:Tfp pilus assembly PilM family ATPase
MRVLLLSADGALAELIAEAVEGCKLEISVLEPDPFPVIRSLGQLLGARGLVWRGQPLGYVVYGGKHTDMFVAQGQEVRFLRTLQLGFERVVSTAAAKFFCSEEEAASILQRRDTFVTEEGQISCVLEGDRVLCDASEEFRKLVREIRRLLHYYQSLYPERSYEGLLDRLVFTGGGANTSGLDKFLSSELGVSVYNVNPFSQLPSKMTPESFKTLDGRESSFAVALGLAEGEFGGHSAKAGDRATDAREIIWRRSAA